MMGKLSTRREVKRACQRDLTTITITHPNIRTAVDAVYMLGRLNRALRNVQMEIERIAQRAAGSDDLTLMHWYVLVHLLEESICKQVDLRAHLGIAPPHLTKLLDDLVALRFVRRDKCPQDRRQFILTLTLAGRDTCMRFLGSFNGVEKMRPFGKIALILSRELEEQWGHDCS
jgi:DNA-binding MarR family transcriptional regulator